MKTNYVYCLYWLGNVCLLKSVRICIQFQEYLSQELAYINEETCFIGGYAIEVPAVLSGVLSRDQLNSKKTGFLLLVNSF